MKLKKKPLSLSQQLRFQLQLYWEQGTKEKTFDEYYEERMKIMIDQIKARIHG